MRLNKGIYHRIAGFFFIACISLYLVSSCNEGTNEKPALKTETIQLISNPGFLNGMGLQGTNSANPDVEEVLTPFGKNALPFSWKLAQWGSRYDLYGAKPKKEANGSVTYSNVAKRINFLRVNDSTTQFSTAVFASKEFDAPRKPSQNWPGLLFGQPFHKKVFLTQIKKLKFKLDARLVFVKNEMSPSDYNKSIHTAQYGLSLSIQNLNKSSPGYGDYFWFGLSLYDYRYKTIKHTESKDYNAGGGFGTGKFIYDVAGKYIYKGSFHDKSWKHISVDLFPYIKKAFYEAKKKGFLKNSNFNDMAVSAITIGWEMPGTFDGGFQIKGISLKAVVKE
jgi:hypothetical protein